MSMEWCMYAWSSEWEHTKRLQMNWGLISCCEKNKKSLKENSFLEFLEYLEIGNWKERDHAKGNPKLKSKIFI